MSSLFLGKTVSKHGTFEIHAMTNNLYSRGFSAEEIGDAELFSKILDGRYELLAHGKPIYCTAVNSNQEQKIEKILMTMICFLI